MNTLDDLPIVMRAEHVAALLGIAKNTVYELAKRGDIPGVIPLAGRQLRFSRSAILNWIDGSATPAAGNLGREWN